MDAMQTFQHYRREDVRQALVECAANREIAVKFGDKGFGKRPDVLQFPRDVVEFAQQGATSFHASEERWKNPLQLRPSAHKGDMEKLRMGWDLVLDIDSKFVELNKIAGHLLIQAIQHHGVHAVSCKFSGGSGFHIGVPFEAFPEKVHDREICQWFPEGPRAVALYLKDFISKQLQQAYLERIGIDGILKMTGKPFGEIVKNSKFDPFSVIGIDTLLISPRHLFRMPYSFNEKTGMVSVPLNPEHVLSFEPATALQKNVHVSKFVFLDRKRAKPMEAYGLLLQAFDYVLQLEEKKSTVPYEGKSEEVGEAIPEQFFPPCIKKILLGLRDGRKRAVFILLNFLRSVGWDYDAIERRLQEWNKVNPEPLRDVVLVGQLRYHKANNKKVFPPNCSNAMYYKDLGVACPLDICGKFKNPVNFTKAQVRHLAKAGKKGVKKEVKKGSTKEAGNESRKEGPKEDKAVAAGSKDVSAENLQANETKST